VTLIEKPFGKAELFTAVRHQLDHGSAGGSEPVS
jgi:hypothetical protein